MAEAECIGEGYLDKRSPKSVFGIRAWQSRYFVLSVTSLRYFKTRQEFTDKKEVTGEINISLIKEVLMPKDDDTGCCFDVHLEGADRVFELRAASGVEAQRWCQMIEVAALQHRQEFLAPAPPPSHPSDKFWKPVTESTASSPSSSSNSSSTSEPPQPTKRALSSIPVQSFSAPSPKAAEPDSAGSSLDKKAEPYDESASESSSSSATESTKSNSASSSASSSSNSSPAAPPPVPTKGLPSVSGRLSVINKPLQLISIDENQTDEAGSKMSSMQLNDDEASTAVVSPTSVRMTNRSAAFATSAGRRHKSGVDQLDSLVASALDLPGSHSSGGLDSSLFSSTHGSGNSSFASPSSSTTILNEFDLDQLQSRPASHSLAARPMSMRHHQGGGAGR